MGNSHSIFHIPMHFSMVGVRYFQKDNSKSHISKFWNGNWNVDVVRGLIVGVEDKSPGLDRQENTSFSLQTLTGKRKTRDGKARPSLK